MHVSTITNFAKRHGVPLVIACAAAALTATGCSRESPVVPPPGETPEEVWLGELMYRLTVASRDEVVVTVAANYVDGAVLVDGETAGRFESGGGSYELNARVRVDPAVPFHTLSLTLRREGDASLYRYDIWGYRHRFAESFDEERLVAFDASLLDFSLSPDRSVFYYLVHGSNGAPPALHALQVASGRHEIVDTFFRSTRIRAVSATRLVAPLPVPGSSPSEDRALLHIYDTATRHYEPKWEVSDSYLRLTEIVDNCLVTNQPYWSQGPSGMVINVDDGTVQRLEIDYRLLRPHTVSHIWLGNDVLDPLLRSFVPVPNGDSPNFIAFLFSEDGRSVAGVEMKGASALYEKVLAVYHDGRLVFDEGRSFRSKHVHAVDGSLDDKVFLVYQSDLLSSESSQRTANGFYRVDRRTGDPVLVHTALPSQQDYQVAPGVILSKRADGLYRMTQR